MSKEILFLILKRNFYWKVESKSNLQWEYFTSKDAEQAPEGEVHDYHHLHHHHHHHHPNIQYYCHQITQKSFTFAFTNFLKLHFTNF